jgi:sialic acid synthase SpsE
VENKIISDEHAKTSLKEHLTNLELHFERYFPSFDEAKHRQKLWIFSPFDDNAIEQAGISEEIKEQLFELSTDSVLKMQGMGLHDVPEFWQKMKVHC